MMSQKITYLAALFSRLVNNQNSFQGFILPRFLLLVRFDSIKEMSSQINHLSVLISPRHRRQVGRPRSRCVDSMVGWITQAAFAQSTS